MFLFYIVTGIATMVVFNQAPRGAEGTAATLASIAQHATIVRLSALLTLLPFFIAVALAVALYALTRDQDSHLAMIALCCRVGEGMISPVSAIRTLQLLAVATASTAADATEAAATQALGGLLLKEGSLGVPIAATCFAVGSTIYSYLFLRARSIPIALAWLGVLESVLLVVALLVQLAGYLRGPMVYYVWTPMAVFEVTLGLWLIIKGVAVTPQMRPDGAVVS